MPYSITTLPEDIIELKLWDDISQYEFTTMLEQLYKILDKQKVQQTPSRVLVDFSKLNDSPDEDVLRLARQSLKDRPDVISAVYGASKAIQHLVNTLTFLARTKVKMFSTRDEALAWLREQHTTTS